VDTKWLEDFVSLAETRSFSRSAQLRHVTQPAFSRRIQALEAWAGIDLVDRSSFPTRLTPAGETFHGQAVELLALLAATRNMLRGHLVAGDDMIVFAVPHSLAFSFFPHWIGELRERFGALKTRLVTLNMHDAVLQLTEGHCDLLLAYHHPSQPLQLDPQRYEMLSLGHETLAPYARRTEKGEPMFRLAADAGRIPYLSYGAGAYLGRLVEVILKQSAQPLPLDPVFETDMAEGLKAMALEGHGLAFLPASSVAREVEARRLTLAGAGAEHELVIELRIYREKPEAARSAKPPARELWELLSRTRA
jgi:DNA-binding transcriptional LysR family regulator